MESREAPGGAILMTIGPPDSRMRLLRRTITDLITGDSVQAVYLAEALQYSATLMSTQQIGFLDLRPYH